MRRVLLVTSLLTMIAGIVPAWAACAVVEGDRITGRDLALAHPGFSGLDPAADIGAAPGVGAQRVMPATELELLARRWGVELGSARTVCFERLAQVLSAEKLRPVLERALREADVEILDFSRQPLPLGQLEFERAGLGPNGLWRGRLVYGTGRSVPVWVRVRVTDRATGQPMMASPAGGKPLVRRGEVVQVEVRGKGVRLAFSAAAEGSAGMGETVPIRNPSNGRRFRAVVEGKGKVGIEEWNW
jgi:hypothetical protein